MASRRETRCTDYSASPKSQSSCECCRFFRCPHFLYMQESLWQPNAACSEVGGRAVSLRQNNLGSLIAQKRKDVFTFFSLALIIHCKTEICCSRELACCRRTEPNTGGWLAIHPGALYPISTAPKHFKGTSSSLPVQAQGSRERNYFSPNAQVAKPPAAC